MNVSLAIFNLLAVSAAGWQQDSGNVSSCRALVRSWNMWSNLAFVILMVLMFT